MNEDEEKEEEAVRVAKMRMRFTKMVEETKAMLDDSPDLVSDGIDILAKLKKMLDANEKGEDDVSPNQNHFSSKSQRTGTNGFRLWMPKSPLC